MYSKRTTLTVLTLLLLAIPMISTPVAATKPTSTSSYWFECTAGYKVHSDIYQIRPDYSVWFLGIDVYHVHASNFGSDYGLVIYYWFNPISSAVDPIGFFSNKIGPPFPYSPFSVSRKGLTVTATDLPLSGLPTTVEVTANPYLGRPMKIPSEFQTIYLPSMIVTFQGTWSAVSATEYFVFNVRVTIGPI